MDLETVIEDLAPRLLRYCRGRGSVDLAEETTQEALTALVAHWRRWGAPRNADAFAFAIARRRLARKQFRQRLIDGLDSLRGRSDDRPDPELRAVHRGQLADALRALDRLPAKLREALLLVTAAELDTATAAQVLGISLSALKMRVSRARQQMQQALRREARSELQEERHVEA